MADCIHKHCNIVIIFSRFQQGAVKKKNTYRLPLHFAMVLFVDTYNSQPKTNERLTKLIFKMCTIAIFVVFYLLLSVKRLISLVSFTKKNGTVWIRCRSPKRFFFKVFIQIEAIKILIRDVPRN